MKTETKKCHHCGASVCIDTNTWWAKNGIPDECPSCHQPYNTPVQPARQAHADSDTDTAIIGIGGIGICSQNEMPTIPSEQALKRYDEMDRRAHYCKRCGQSDVDGAMFTTNPNSGLCDDCGG